MVQRLPTHAGSLHKNLQVIYNLVLSPEIIKNLRPQGRLEFPFYVVIAYIEIILHILDKTACEPSLQR
jgi:hypothetical protein